MKNEKSYLWVLVIVASIVCSCSQEKKKEIVCWGDSLTAPNGGTGIKGIIKRIIKGSAYPDYLQNMLNDDYKVINAGICGENTLTIMARQGSYPMKIAHKVVVVQGVKTYIGNNVSNEFISTYNGKAVTPLLQGGWDEDSPSFINPCKINGKNFLLSSELKCWLEKRKFKFGYNYFIEAKDNLSTTDTLKSGSTVETYAMNHLRKKYANVFFIGQNGGFDNTADLIRQLKAMISYSESERYIVISFHKPNKIIKTIPQMKEMEDSLSMIFGQHFINLREYMVSKGLADAGLEPTQEDKDSISRGQVPPQLMTDNVHFTTVGYKEIATLVLNKMKELGY